MKDVMGIIYTSKNDLRLRELTMSRAVAALPVAGRYRIVDFILSNMVNSGIRNVGIIMQRNYHSLMDHLGSGKEWDLHTRNDGLFILPPYLTRENVGSYAGIIDALRSNAGYLRRSKQENVILTNSHTVFNTTFEDMIEQHESSGADITLMYTKASRENLDPDPQFLDRRVYMRVEDGGRVSDLEIGPAEPVNDNLYMDVLVIRRDLLRHLLDQAAAHSFRDFNRDLLQQPILNRTLTVYGYEYKGYCRRIESVQSYYNFNLDLLDFGVRRELFSINPVYTKVRDEVPARYLEDAYSFNSLIADGCIIEGSVKNSVLFRGVRIGKGAQVKNCIIMQDSDVQAGVELENVILDKMCTIRQGGRLIGQPKYPIVVGKNATL